MESDRERSLRNVLKLSSGLIGVRRLISWLEYEEGMEFKERGHVDIENALEKLKAVNKGDLPSDLKKSNIDLKLLYDAACASEEYQNEFLDLYLDYLEEKVREK